MEAEPVLEQPASSTQGLVLRNALVLVVAQLVSTPLSILVNAVMARHLGPQDFGYIYLASTFCSFGFLFVEWGQGGTLPARVARERSRAGEFLGTGLAWRLGSALAVYGVLALGSRLLGYDVEFQVALGLVALGYTVGTVSTACQDTARGFERTDVAAYGFVGQQLAAVLLVVPTLLAGGKLRAVLGVQAFAGVLVGILVWRALRTTRIGRLSVRQDTLRGLLSDGSPFLFLGLALAIQPNVDALLLSKLAPAEVVGWHAAARKLVGVLIFPAAALINALYPTLCRLHAEDREGYLRTAASGLRTATVLVVPLALGCALYPDLGIRIFSRETFGPAEDNLRVLSIFVLLVYFSMPLGSSLAAAGLQRPWAFCQLMCVVVSAVFDPLLVPWFQERSGNGGLGVCVATVLSEILMVGAGFWLLPRGVLTRSLFKGIGLAGLAGVAMAAVAWVLSGITPFVAAPVAVAAYGGCLYATGGLDKEQVQAFREAVARKLKRRG